MGKSLLMQAVYFGLGLLISQGTVFETYAPFGAALVAAAPFRVLIAAAGGAAMGYLLPFGIGDGVRYLAAVLATAAIRWTLNDLKRVRAHPLFAPLVAMGPVVATGIAIGTVEGVTSHTIVMSLPEGLLAAGAAYFFACTVSITDSSRGLSALKQQELASVVLSSCIVVLSFSHIMVGSVSLGRVLAVLAILLCAHYGGVPGGSVSGVAAGLVFSLSGSGVSYLAGSYAFGGLMAGMFSALGRMGTVIAFILSNAIVSLSSGDAAAVIGGLYEVAAATLLFMLLPKQVGSRISSIFAAPPASKKLQSSHVKEDSLRRAVVSKLGFASKALADVSDSVEEVSQKLGKLSVSSPHDICSRVTASTCRRCGMKEFCWDQNREGTRAVFEEAMARLQEKGNITLEDFAPYFSRKCSKINEVVERINEQYGIYTAREVAERRVAQVRGVVSGQFSGMSEMLRDLSREMEQCERFDPIAEERLESFLKKSGVHPVDLSCRLDEGGRMTVEWECSRQDKKIFTGREWQSKFNQVCDRAMDKPCISCTADLCRVMASEKPLLGAKIGKAQHICNNGELCGDHYDVFPDGRGHLVVVISDGMGTGGRAAVDGAMAAGIFSRLYQAGLSLDCALGIVNSALVVKSGDESLATLDVAVIDLFTGETEFLKAGAPVTLIKRKDRVIRIDAPSLPAGILTEIGFARERASLDSGDWVLMVSDGAVANGDEWLEDVLAQWKGEEEQELADYVVKQASLRRTDGHDDDVTAIAVRLQK